MRSLPPYKVKPGTQVEDFHKGGLGRNEFCRLLLGPFGSGKTVATCWDVFMLARSQPKQSDGKRRSRFAFVRNTKPMLRDMTIKTWLDWFPEDPTIGTYTSSIGRYLLNYEDLECEILFKALDDPDDVKNVLGLELTGAFLNEAREIDKTIWEGLSGRVGRYPRIIDIMDALAWSQRPPAKPGRWWRRASDRPSVDEVMLVALDPAYPAKLTPTDDAFEAVPLTVVVPGVEWVKAPWSGMLADSNPCAVGDYMYNLFEVQAKQDPMIGALYKLYHQPPGLINVNKRWRSNPHAENLDNLKPGYYLNQAIGKDKQWIRVYCEGKYGVVMDGQPVYSGFDEDWHVREFVFDPHLPVYVGWDFGVRAQACVFAQLSTRGQLRVFEEIYAENIPLNQFVRDMVIPRIGKYPKAIWEHSAADPAGNKRSDTDESQSLEMLNDAYPGRELGLPFATYPASTNALATRIGAVGFFINNNVAKEAGESVAPKFLVHSRCLMLVEGFVGRYEFERVHGTDGRYKEVPSKNKWSHCFTAEVLVSTGEGRKRIADIRPGDLVRTHAGLRRVTTTMCQTAPTMYLIFDDGRSIRCTPNHPFVTERGLVRADELQYTDVLQDESALWPDQASIPYKCTTESGSIENRPDTTRRTTATMERSTRIGTFGSRLTEQFLKAFTFITKTGTAQTIDWKTWKRLAWETTFELTRQLAIQLSSNSGIEPSSNAEFRHRKFGMGLKKVLNGIANTAKTWRLKWRYYPQRALSVHTAGARMPAPRGYASSQTLSAPLRARQGFEFNQAKMTSIASVLCAAQSSELIATEKPRRAPRLVGVRHSLSASVYDLTVEDAHTFYAEGLLVHNCNDALQYLALGILATTDISGDDPDPFELSSSNLKSAINSRPYSGY